MTPDCSPEIKHQLLSAANHKYCWSCGIDLSGDEISIPELTDQLAKMTDELYEAKLDIEEWDERHDKKSGELEEARDDLANMRGEMEDLENKWDEERTRLDKEIADLEDQLANI